MGCCRPLWGHTPGDPLAVTQAAGRLATEQGRGAADRSRELPPPKLIPFCGVPVQDQQPCGTELSVHSTATNRKNKQQRQLWSPCRPIQQAWKEKLLSPRDQFAQAATIRDVVPQPHNAEAVSCVSSRMCGRVLLTHSVHTLTHTHTRNPVSCCPAQQGCESHVTTARGLRQASHCRLLQGPSLYSSSFQLGPQKV